MLHINKEKPQEAVFCSVQCYFRPTKNVHFHSCRDASWLIGCLLLAEGEWCAVFGKPSWTIDKTCPSSSYTSNREKKKDLDFFARPQSLVAWPILLTSSWDIKLERFSNLSVLILRSDIGFLIFPWPRKMTKKKKSSSEQTDLGRPLTKRLWERLLLNLAICIMDWEKAENVFLLKVPKKRTEECNTLLLLERGCSRIRSSLLEPHLGYRDQFGNFRLFYVSSPPSLQPLSTNPAMQL